MIVALLKLTVIYLPMVAKPVKRGAIERRIKMNQKKIVLVSALMSIFSNVSFSAMGIVNFSNVKDITCPAVPGANYGSDPRPGIGVSGRVNSGCVADSTYDYRGMGWDPDQKLLYVWGGFNYLTTNNGVAAGDIFINFDGLPIAPSRPSLSNGHFNYPNPGFDACVHLQGADGMNLKSSLWLLSPNSVVQSGFYAQNGAFDPWASVITSADVALSCQDSSPVTIMTDAEIRTFMGIDSGDNGGPNYVAFFDLKPIASMFTANTTFLHGMQCSNEYVEGSLVNISSIPEVTNSLAMGFFLSLMAFLRSPAMRLRSRLRAG